MRQKEDSRAFSRARIAVAARITPEGGTEVEAQIRDMSLHGIMVQVDQPLEIGQQCRIRILFGHYQHEFPIIAAGTVVRRKGNFMAIRFDTVGFEAAEELESMILTHSDDPEEVLTEFALDEIYFDPLSATDFNPDEPH